MYSLWTTALVVHRPVEDGGGADPGILVVGSDITVGPGRDGARSRDRAPCSSFGCGDAYSATTSTMIGAMTSAWSLMLTSVSPSSLIGSSSAIVRRSIS